MLASILQQNRRSGGLEAMHGCWVLDRSWPPTDLSRLYNMDCYQEMLETSEIGILMMTAGIVLIYFYVVSFLVDVVDCLIRTDRRLYKSYRLQSK